MNQPLASRLRPRRMGLAIGILVTTLSVLTMSSLAFGVLLNQFDNKTALPCDQVPGTPQAFEGKEHIAYQGASHAPYKTMPPTSGPHSPRVVTPGIYRDPIPEELQVHILEHGHVLIQYGPDVSKADIERIERIGRQHPRDAVVAPYPPLGHGIAVTGWQRLQRFDTYDETAILDFVTKVANRYNHLWRDKATDCVTP
ncbi:DUF3105 domain-containing protein [Kribbella qitaiheensis]|uniref:DUF3105 domain-containing protein n=1 Tax=Kribbella qitaiheensis TaxID=1544730 RepID=A0A7G6X337_9ACTN|nr:DUF3105 domain-containing protein [Kribbella qitaiheensis]QNE20652.1 DUF3105 domain-containing protein [Kribbella qitaiheensis]